MTTEADLVEENRQLRVRLEALEALAREVVSVADAAEHSHDPRAAQAWLRQVGQTASTVLGYLAPKAVKPQAEEPQP